MKRPRTQTYPDDEFLRDFAEWKSAVNDPDPEWWNGGQEAADRLLAHRYPTAAAYRYHRNRFACILRTAYGDLPRLIQDRIAKPDGEDGGYLPVDMLLALLAWYRKVPEKSMEQMPLPDWAWVLGEFDRLDTFRPPE